MRRAGLALFVGMALASAPGFCDPPGQVRPPFAASSGHTTPGANTQDQLLFPNPAVTNNNFMAGLLTNNAAIASQAIPVITLTNGVVRRLGRSLTNELPQGIYRAEPYSMIVASPGAFADNIITPQESADRMTIIKPELRLVPLK